MLSTFNCPNCGAPAEDAGAKACSYCSSPFIIKTTANFSTKTLINYTELYKKFTENDPEYLDSQIALIAIYLKRKLSNVAETKAKELLEAYPDSPAPYLWTSIVLMQQDDIRKLKLANIKQITSLISTGYDLSDDEERFDFLHIAHILNAQYFQVNHINPPQRFIEICNEADSFEYTLDADNLVASIFNQ